MDPGFKNGAWDNACFPDSLSRCIQMKMGAIETSTIAALEVASQSPIPSLCCAMASSAAAANTRCMVL